MKKREEKKSYSKYILSPLIKTQTKLKMLQKFFKIIFISFESMVVKFLNKGLVKMIVIEWQPGIILSRSSKGGMRSFTLGIFSLLKI